MLSTIHQGASTLLLLSISVLSYSPVKSQSIRFILEKIKISLQREKKRAKRSESWCVMDFVLWFSGALVLARWTLKCYLKRDFCHFSSFFPFSVQSV